MKYQLVLQFQAEGPQDFEDLEVLEKLIAKTLPADSDLDGHDFGSGEFNIFVLTDRPQESFRSAHWSGRWGSANTLYRSKKQYKGLERDEQGFMDVLRSTYTTLMT